MATNNKALLSKFARLFSSDDFLSTLQNLSIAGKILEFLDPDHDLVIPQDEAGILNAVSQRFDALLSSDQIVDQHLLNYLLSDQIDHKQLKAFGHDLVADIMENPYYANYTDELRHKFELKANDVFGFMDVEYKQMENLNTAVLHEESLRRMVNASSESKRAKKTAHGKIDNALTAFDNKYRNADLEAMAKKPGKYGDSQQSDLLGKLRASYINMLGEEDGNAFANINECLITPADNQSQRNAYLVSAVAAHDETVMAILKRRNLDQKEYENAFLEPVLDGSNQGKQKTDNGNKHFLANALNTLGGAVNTFGLALGASLLGQIPVVGPAIGSGMMIAKAIQKGYGQYKQAKQIAKVQNREFGARDYARIAVGVAADVAPYAITMAASAIPFGRGISTAIRFGKAFYDDLKQQRAKLSKTEKLLPKHYLASAGKAILNGAAMWLGSKAGSTLGSAVMNNFDGQGFVNDMRAKMGLQTEEASANLNAENVADGEVSLDAPETYEEAMEQMQQMQAGRKTILDLESGTKGLQDLQDQQIADWDAQLEAQEYQAKLSGLQKHEFDLTDATRSTANPDTDRMFQANGAGHYQQNDWYSADEYQRAIDTLHEAGVEDADGALRNLAGARMFKGGEFKTELDNLLNGKLTANTIDKIIEADSILDEHGALISNSAAHMQQPAGLATDTTLDNDSTFGPERMTDYKIADQQELTDAEFDELYFGPNRRVIFNEFEKTNEPEPEPEAVVENDPSFGPERMTDYNIDEVTGKTTEEPSFGPERMTDYSVTGQTAETELDTNLETPTVENGTDYVPETNWGTETLTDEATFGLNNAEDYQINNDVVSDWRDNNFDSQMDNALNDITSKYQASTAEQTVEQADELTTTESVAEETSQQKPSWSERRAQAKAERQEARAARQEARAEARAAKQAGEDYSDILDGSKPDWLVGQQTNLKRAGNGMWVMEPDSDSVVEDYDAWKAAQAAQTENTIDDGGREM